MTESLSSQPTPPRPSVRPPASPLVEKLSSDHFDVKENIGGWQGILENTIPATIFVILFVVTKSVTWSAVAALVSSFIFVLIRLLRREPLRHAVTGAVAGVGLGVVWALWSGRGEDFFISSVISASVYTLVLLVTLVMRRPLIGMLIQLFYQLPKQWWSEENYATLVRASTAATWVFTGMFALRFFVMTPLWYFSQVAALGVAKLVLGIPLFAVTTYVAWLIIRPVTPQSSESSAV